MVSRLKRMAARYEFLLGTFVLFAESRSMQVGVFPVERDHAYYHTSMNSHILNLTRLMGRFQAHLLNLTRLMGRFQAMITRATVENDPVPQIFCDIHQNFGHLTPLPTEAASRC
jgi:hypothetical protein